MADMSNDSLLQLLTSLDEQGMARLLSARPEAVMAPVPADLSELAERLASPAAVGAAVKRLPLPALQLLEATQAVGDDQRADQVAALLGRTADDPEFTEILDLLTAAALAWRAGDAIVLLSPLRNAFGPYPLGLGRPLAALVDRRTAAELHATARLLRRPHLRTKREVAADLIAWGQDGDAVRSALTGAPAAALGVLGEAASGDPIVPLETPYGYRRGGSGTDWAIERGLLYPLDWTTAEMPKEVCLALRDEWHAPFNPSKPDPDLVAVSDDAVGGEAAAAASALVDQMTELVRQCEQTPVVPLKTGGIGVREVRRLSKHLGVAEPTARLLIWLAVHAELLAEGDSGLVPTATYDGWASGGPAERYLALATAWLTMPAVPLLEERGDGRVPAPLAQDTMAGYAVTLRPHLLAALAEVPDGHGFANGDRDIAALVAWQAPIAAGTMAEPVALLALLAEARELGLSAMGRLSPLGCGLMAADQRQLVGAAGRLLRSDSASARFQADLSVIVSGTPQRALAELLDGCADMETRGAASIWRFSPGSVRRALDTGISPADLILRLREGAIGGSLPQPLEYLVNDVARRHGQIRVRAAGCVLCATDVTLLDEVLAARSLRRLRLSRIAPTVVVSAEPPAQTLESLRAAGYAPVNEDSAGVAILERPDRHRAEPPGPRSRSARPGGSAVGGSRPSPAEPADPVLLAKALIAAGTGDPAARQLSSTAKMIADLAPRMAKADVRVLAKAIDSGTPVEIMYTDVNGRTTQRVIEDIELAGHVVEAYCRLREDNRYFAVSRIDAVSPV